MNTVFNIFKKVGFDFILKLVLFIRSAVIHKQDVRMLKDHRFWSFMRQERKEDIPSWIIEDKGRKDLADTFFPIKVVIFEDAMKDVVRRFEYSKVIEFHPNKIRDLCAIYDKRAIDEFDKKFSFLRERNNSMRIFVEKFGELHRPAIEKTVVRFESIFEMEHLSKADQIYMMLETLYWAFKFSMPSVKSAMDTLNGTLSAELDKIYGERDAK